MMIIIMVIIIMMMKMLPTMMMIIMVIIIIMMKMLSPAMDDNRTGAASVWLVHFPDGHRLSHAQSWWWEQFLWSNVNYLTFFQPSLLNQCLDELTLVFFCCNMSIARPSLKIIEIHKCALGIFIVRKGFRSKMLTFLSLWRGGWSRLVVGCLVEGG